MSGFPREGGGEAEKEGGGDIPGGWSRTIFRPVTENGPFYRLKTGHSTA